MTVFGSRRQNRRVGGFSAMSTNDQFFLRILHIQKVRVCVEKPERGAMWISLEIPLLNSFIK